MKADFTLEEIKKIMKKSEKNSRLRTFILIVSGMAVIVGIIVLILLKAKSRPEFEYDDWSELDDMDYDDFDDYDEYEFEDEDYDFDEEDLDDEDSVENE